MLLLHRSKSFRRCRKLNLYRINDTASTSNKMKNEFEERMGNIMKVIKKTKKVIAVLVLCCTAILLGSLNKNIFGFDYKTKNMLNAKNTVSQLNSMMPISMSPTQRDTPQDNSTIEIKPVPASVETNSLPAIKKTDPEFMERTKQIKEESQKSVTGVFDTEMDIKQEDSGVKLDFSLHNISDKDLALYFRSSQKFDIFITDSNGDEVYRWSHGKGFLMSIIEIELKKYEKLSFSEVWGYTDNNGNRVPPGKYSITVKLLPKLKNGKNISPDELMAVKDIEVK